MLIDEQVGMSHAREAHHGVVEVLDPAAHGFSIAQLDGDGHLTIAKGPQVERFLAGFAGRRGLGTTARGEWWSHDAILDALKLEEEIRKMQGWLSISSDTNSAARLARKRSATSTTEE